MKKHIVLLSPHKAMIDCALRHNLDITVLDSPERQEYYSGCGVCRLLFCDISDIALSRALLEGLHRHKKIDALVTLTEQALLPAAELCASLGLPSLPLEVVRRISDKQQMRRFLRADSDFAVQFAYLESKEALAAFAERAGLPIIVKPKEGTGSRGVVKLASKADIAAFPLAEGSLAEEFLPGEEYSVEAFSFAGRHQIFAITRKELIESENGDNFTEIGHYMPALLPPPQQAAVTAYIRKFLDYIGLRDGASHTEIKIAGGRIKIIETHNRIGGDRISSLVRLSTGADLVELALLWPLGLCAPPQADNVPHQAAAIRFFTPPCGRLAAVIGAESLFCRPHIIAVEIGCKAGDIIRPITESAGRYGFVIAVGETARQAAAYAAEAAAAVRFVVE